MKIFKSNEFKIALAVIGGLGILMLFLGLIIAYIFDMDFGTGMKWSAIVMGILAVL